MLRDLYVAGSDELQAILQEFQLGKAKLIDVKLYQMLTPDSFIWCLRMSDGIYYLYAEDYVPNLAHVEQAIQKVVGSRKGEFVGVKQTKYFEELTPVQSATTYQKPDNYDEQIKQFAADSGFDLVFLYKTGEHDEIEEIEFSRHV